MERLMISASAAILVAFAAPVFAEGALYVVPCASQPGIAPTKSERIALLREGDLLSDFLTLESPGGVTSSAGGSTIRAASRSLTAVVGQGVSMSVLIKNGACFADTGLALGTTDVFLDATHFETNLSCKQPLFVASFNREDPGVDQVVDTTLRGLDVQQAADPQDLIPDKSIIGADKRLARCGIARMAHSTLQRYTRIALNALPESVEAQLVQTEVSSIGILAEGEGKIATGAEGETTAQGESSPSVIVRYPALEAQEAAKEEKAAGRGAV
ncbi:hypothetical protein K488DRAFT_67147 [Vararia minispora EC-137]|uniref:Uncharacterized protein n=1 Tax=Vararia minispora EC-137 TaxID=1314806 RepID=A0ACB8QYR3_9AGAM|nr:hypothetical protein K488DRAFT_67147 [Vararia minispora EC-137]